MNYRPKPIDTTAIELSPEILKLTEHLAENAHDIWAAQRLSEGWTYGPERNDRQKRHPFPTSTCPTAKNNTTATPRWKRSKR